MDTKRYFKVSQGKRRSEFTYKSEGFSNIGEIAVNANRRAHNPKVVDSNPAPATSYFKGLPDVG